jgi:LPS-assembly protein
VKIRGQFSPRLLGFCAFVLASARSTKRTCGRLKFNALIVSAREDFTRLLLFSFCSSGRNALARLLLAVLAGCSLFASTQLIHAQQTNPVDRKVTNPMTDTPSVNPLNNDQPVQRRPQQGGVPGVPSDRLSVNAATQAVSGTDAARIVVYEGNVDIRIGTYRLQANKVTVYEAENRVVAEGSVVFDQAEQQRITGSKSEWNYRTKTGYFLDSTGYTNQTQDGTRIYFTADRVEKISLDTIVATNVQVTACDEDIPKWSFHAGKARIKTGDRVRIYSPHLKVKRLPIFYLPYASMSIKARDRASGFLTPTFGGSGSKGFRLSNAYYLTLGRSADFTLRNDIYTSRGVGIGGDLRTRANSRSFLNAGFYAVKDRIFGPKADATHPDQGGSSFYVEGVHYFRNGFTAAADVNITSNLAFRQIFSDSIQQAISPEETSQVFVNKDHNEYSFNFLARNQVTSLSNVRIRIRELPSVTIDKRPTILKFLKDLPVYYSFSAAAEGVSRKETVEDAVQFVNDVGGNPIISPSIVQRLDLHPRFELPITFAGWSLTASAAGRVTFYSNSVDPTTRNVLSRNLTRSYGEFEFDVRPPALAKDFHRGDGSFFFRHTIEPFITYRKLTGINNFDRIIRFDYIDAIADTNEIEFGVANRFFTRRSTENVSDTGLNGERQEERKLLSDQPYEALTVTVRGKYFFDPTFGGALEPGRRNQFYPLNTLSGFAYGGVPRRFSPLNIDARYRPRRHLFVDLRTDLDTHGGGLRALSTTVGLNRTLIQIFQSFYYTRAIELVPSLARFADSRGFEAGTLRGSQWSPSIFLGNRDRGLFGGASFFYDFQKRPGRGDSSLISSTLTIGNSWDCCAVTAQLSTFNVGLRKENRVVFSFRLNGIGTFGTEQIGQHVK